jgi:hypothetical protein
MKLKPQPKLLPEQLRLIVPGEVMQDLKLYQQYQQEVEHTTWDLRELATEILRTFLTEGDKAFLRWRKQRSNGAVTKQSTTEAGEGVVRGGAANARISLAPPGV